MKHLFLTGEKQVGKSTLLRRLLGELGLAPAGFETRLWMQDGMRHGFFFHSFLPVDPYYNDCPCTLRVAPQQTVAVLPVFEQIGVRCLRAAQESDRSVILLDELGKLERDAFGFQREVLACLDGSKPVLGVLQKGDYPLSAAIRAREDVLLLTVTPENRDMLFSQALEALRAALANAQ